MSCSVALRETFVTFTLLTGAATGTSTVAVAIARVVEQRRVESRPAAAAVVIRG